MRPLKFFSTAIVEKLAAEIESNLDRYTAKDFLDLAKESGWALETDKALVDEQLLAQLLPEATPEAEAENSLIVYQALAGFTPAMARDERIWARLCHVEGIDYVRARWLKSGTLESRIRSHFFAAGFPGCRDDNAIGRLWWNAHIANLACPNDLKLGLSRLLSRANVRLQIVDRADSAFRQPLVSGIIRKLENEWFQSYDAAIADFMFEVNKTSGGIIFEALSTEQVDAHLAFCMETAKRRNQ
ncbi:MAG: DUF6339 family protein [Burkholderiaceae bacterium]|nr:DUF6339 family protein [Polaromonas sp.]MDO8778619.1 DUF6339 family protein [Burkholderiaceae bacterium]